jgi:hypothetical protein
MARPSDRGPDYIKVVTDDGVVGSIEIGDADDKVGFHGADPVVQSSGALQAAPAAYVTGAFGLNSDANMEALYDLVVEMRTTLVNLGLMKGSA